jgi:hypothetical protein
LAVRHRGRLRAFGSPEELAVGMWEGIGAELDLGAPAGPDVLEALAAVPGVLEVGPSPAGATLSVRDRDVVPTVVASMVAREIAVFGAAARPHSLEDVYFEIERRILAETGDVDAVDGFSERYRGEDAP